MMDNELRIVQGNTFATAIEIHAVDATGQPIVDWSLQDSTDIRVWFVFAGREQDITTWQIDDGKLVIVWLANMQRVGTYDIFCAGKYNGADWRNAMQYQFSIVRFNHEANIPANVVILDGIYQLSAELQIITQFAGGGGGTPSQTIPLMDGEASVGEENAYARGDHRHPSDTSKQDKIDNAHKLDYSLLDNTPTIPAAQVNSDWNANSGVAQILNKPAIPAAQVQSDWDEVDTDSKAYIQNKPTIPAAQVQSDWNEVDNTKADYIKNKPTIPSISGLESTSNKVTSLSAASTDTQYPSAKCVYDGLGGKQDTIDSSHKLDYSLLDNTPTIPAAQVNSDWDAASGVAQILNKPAIPSTLAELGDDTTHRVVTDTQISTWDNKANKVTIVNHGTDDTTYSVTPNTLHIWGEVASLTLTLATPTDATIVNEYMIQFESGSTATTLSLPATVEWAESCGALSVEASKTYQISIVNNIGLWASISNS